MSTEFQKWVAQHELMKRSMARAEEELKAISHLSTEELEKILTEPDEPEKKV